MCVHFVPYHVQSQPIDTNTLCFVHAVFCDDISYSIPCMSNTGWGVLCAILFVTVIVPRPFYRNDVRDYALSMSLFKRKSVGC